MRRSSTASNWRVDSWVVIATTALVAVLFYLIVSARIYRLGFPLDDAWIHLTYARNIAERGEWSFRLGERSAGSTSPLWTALLSLGFLLNLAPYVWTYLVGCLRDGNAIAWADHLGCAGDPHQRFAALPGFGPAHWHRRLGSAGRCNI